MGNILLLQYRLTRLKSDRQTDRHRHNNRTDATCCRA